MTDIEGYKIIGTEHVEERLQQGWELYGSPVIDPLTDGLFQAMIKRREPEKLVPAKPSKKPGTITRRP